MAERLNLLVLRCKHPAATARFYEPLGHTFHEHQHGTGPVHLASESPDFVLELYPSDTPDTCGLGFVVSDLDACTKHVAATGATVTAPKDNPWGRSCVARDPDGRRVELLQAKP